MEVLDDDHRIVQPKRRFAIVRASQDRFSMLYPIKVHQRQRSPDSETGQRRNA